MKSDLSRCCSVILGHPILLTDCRTRLLRIAPRELSAEQDGEFGDIWYVRLGKINISLDILFLGHVSLKS